MYISAIFLSLCANSNKQFSRTFFSCILFMLVFNIVYTYYIQEAKKKKKSKLQIKQTIVYCVIGLPR